MVTGDVDIDNEATVMLVGSFLHTVVSSPRSSRRYAVRDATTRGLTQWGINALPFFDL
jgi:hypothetical protein